jgi:type III secretion system (T3SS) SseB-like protein
LGFLNRFHGPERSPSDLLVRELLVPTPDLGHPAGAFVSAADGSLQLPTLPDDDGLLVLPAFTNEAALGRWIPDGTPFVALEGRALLEILVDGPWDRMVVDGADSSAFAITPHQAGALLGVAPTAIAAGTPVRLGQPAAPFADGLREAIEGACAREPRVAEAYLYQLQVDVDEPRPAVGVLFHADVPQHEAADAMRTIADAAQPRTWGYEYVSVHPLEGEWLDEVRGTGPPIYSAR